MNKRSSQYVAIAEWKNNLFGSPPTPLFYDVQLRPVKIHYFAKVSFTLDKSSTCTSCIFAVVSWYCQHPLFNRIGKPAEIWNCDTFENNGRHYFVPLNCLISRCAYCIQKHFGQPALAVVPIVE